ncbi:MAG: DUF4340 domain-containing protein [Deltaproteobacteria bacterium]|nr:DUF4340 domain-containing protein [Deltaproteobacteria bacterium]
MSKKILILLAAVFILGTVVVIVEKPFHERFDTGEGSLFYPDLKEADIAAIEIEYLVNGTRFEKDLDGKWVVSLKETAIQKKIEEADKKEAKNKSAEKGKQEKSTAEKTAQKKLPAEPSKVEELITTLVELKKGTPVTDDPEKQGPLELTNAALNVALFDAKGKKLARLFVGKQGPDIFSTFVRDETDGHIYLVDEQLSGIFNRPIEEWAKKEEEKEKN